MNFLVTQYEFRGGRPVIAILIGIGMRIGEYLAITWDYRNFENRPISVNHNLSYSPMPKNECVFHISTPKTDAGRRIVLMINEIY